MPKSKPRRRKRSQPHRVTRPGRSPLYRQPCPDDLLIEEFGEEGASWLVSEYERPLTLADIELEKGIRAGQLTMEHPERRPEELSIETVAKTLWMTMHVIFRAAREQGVSMNASELEAASHYDDALEADDMVTEVRGAHASGFLILNARGLWNFGG